jgi:hypothetical protein
MGVIRLTSAGRAAVILSRTRTLRLRDRRKIIDAISTTIEMGTLGGFPDPPAMLRCRPSRQRSTRSIPAGRGTCLPLLPPPRGRALVARRRNTSSIPPRDLPAPSLHRASAPSSRLASRRLVAERASLILRRSLSAGFARGPRLQAAGFRLIGREAAISFSIVKSRSVKRTS